MLVVFAEVFKIKLGSIPNGADLMVKWFFLFSIETKFERTLLPLQYKGPPQASKYGPARSRVYWNTLPEIYLIFEAGRWIDSTIIVCYVHNENDREGYGL